MQVTMLTKALVFAMLAVCAYAIPTDTKHTLTSRSVSSRELLGSQLGINCRGSALCLGCDDLKDIKDLIDTIDDDTEFSEGVQIACSVCSIDLHGKDGLCAFTQKMGDKKISAKTVKAKMQDLIDHGCKGCGSVPIYEGNNVDTGELTVNYVSKGCGFQVCADSSPSIEGYINPRDDPDTISDNTDIAFEDTTLRDESNPLLGINCRGSGMCSSCGSLSKIAEYMNKVEDYKVFHNGQQIVCNLCNQPPDRRNPQGLCAFLQKFGENQLLGMDAKAKVNDLIKHGCHVCGSVPIFPGNNVNSGELTVNFVSRACGEGMCR